MDRFWTSDTHFYHANVIPYCDRPWLQKGDWQDGEWASEEIKTKRANEMTEDMIERWNSVVKPGDIVYHCGDFGFSARHKIEKLIKSLNGQIHLYPGNHDKRLKAKGFACIKLYDLIKMPDNQKIMNCHYPMASWDCSHRDSWMCFGHVHGIYNPVVKLLIESMKVAEVGVDLHDYTPIHYDKLCELMKGKNGYHK